jgi:hypothetical protein
MGLVTIFYCLRIETSLFVASYDSKGYGGGIQPCLHTGFLSIRINFSPEFILNNIYNSSSYLTGTHYVSTTKPNRLMLFGETVPVYCENHTEHISVRTSQETYLSATKTKRLMLFGETVPVYCENHTKHTDIYKLSSYLTGNTLLLRYKAQPVNAVWGNSHCLL